MQPQQTVLQCSNCGTPNEVVVRRIIDAIQDPQGKAQLLNGRINSFTCENCGTTNSVSSPLLYHDQTKELIIAFVPMDVAARQQGMNQSEEKVVGDLMNTLTSSIPKEQFKAYMFNPKRALTMQGLIEQILEADGITKEMIDGQKKRVELIQNMMEADSEENLIQRIKDADEKIDENFFQTLTLMAQRLMQEGQQQVAGSLIAVQQLAIEHSSYGAEIVADQRRQQEVINEVADGLNNLGEGAARADFMDVAISYADDEERLQALVGLIRPAMDYDFFIELTERIEQASDEDREKLEAVRDSLQEYIAQVDEQTRMLVQQKAQFLQALINHPQYDQMLMQNAHMIDDNFMTVLQMNMQEAQKRGDQQIVARLQQIHQTAVQLLQAQMTPEMRFLNDLMSAQDEASLTAMIAEQSGQYDFADMMEVTDAVEELFAGQGQQEGVEHIQRIRTALQNANA